MSKLGILLLVLAACGGKSTPSSTPAPADPVTTPTVGNDGPAGAICGTRGAAECPAGQFCSYEPGADCGETDRPGHCAVRPEVCTQQFAPVCGCDGKTYGNACAAAGAAVGVRADGECK